MPDDDHKVKRAEIIRHAVIEGINSAAVQGLTLAPM